MFIMMWLKIIAECALYKFSLHLNFLVSGSFERDFIVQARPQFLKISHSRQLFYVFLTETVNKVNNFHCCNHNNGWILIENL